MGGAGCETDLRLRALIRFAVITSPRPVSLARRSFDYSKLTCGSSVPFRPASSLIRYDGRGEAWREFSASPGLAVLRPSLRSSDTRDGAMRSSAYLSADGIDGERRRSISGGVFYFDTIPFSFAYAVPPRSSLARYEKRDGAYLSALVPLSVVSRSYRLYSGR